MHCRYNLSPNSRVPDAQVRSKKFFLKEATQFYMFYCFIYIQNKWKFLKKDMHVYKLSLCTYNQILGLLHVAMYVRTERNEGFVSCSDFVGHCNSLSNILTFLLSYTELITLTALELAIGFLEGICYLLF